MKIAAVHHAAGGLRLSADSMKDLTCSLERRSPRMVEHIFTLPLHNIRDDRLSTLIRLAIAQKTVPDKS